MSSLIWGREGVSAAQAAEDASAVMLRPSPMSRAVLSRIRCFELAVSQSSIRARLQLFPTHASRDLDQIRGPLFLVGRPRFARIEHTAPNLRAPRAGAVAVDELGNSVDIVEPIAMEVTDKALVFVLSPRGGVLPCGDS
jgi:hypothetical protein